MATVETTTSRPALGALSSALDAAIEAAVAGRATHRSGTTFIPIDVAVPARARRPYVVVHEDGRQELHPRNYAKVLVGLGLVGLIVWALGRDPA
jgi:hypothetical protein